MKMGMIAPIPNLAEFAQGDFHLLLSHLIESDMGEAYVNHYRNQAQHNDAWLTLDNSAYELQAGGAVENLFKQAVFLGAREIVLPDVMHKMEATKRSGAEALYVLDPLADQLDAMKIQIMLVPQGETIYEWGMCLSHLISMHNAVFPDRIYTIGVAKDYEVFTGGRANLIQRFVEPLRKERRFDVHLLGVGNELTDLSALATRFPWIRSTDSVKPFVYGLHKVRLTMGYMDTPPYPGRPKNYFETPIPEGLKPLVKHNIRIFRDRIGDK